MANIIDYIKWRGDLCFEVSKLNPVDSLIFSELSYMKFYEVLGKEGVETLKTVENLYEKNIENKELGVLLTGEFNELLKVVSGCNRYREIVIKNCVDYKDIEKEIQFSAMIFELSEDTCYVAFRGTDDTLVGWKEDLNMTFMDQVPAQKEALDYLNKVANDYKKIYLGGHSKGGNLAVYAGVYAKTEIKDKIVKIYNHDGPGFKQSIMETKEYLDITERILTILPQSSVVGMLLEHEKDYLVVKSNTRGLLQHDGFSWEVVGADFIYLSDIEDDAKITDMTMRSILEKMDIDQREAFASVFFEVVTVNESKTLTEISKGGIKSLVSMSKNYNGLDKETKKAVNHMFGLIYSEGVQSLIKVKNIDQWDVKFDEWRKDKRLQVRDFLGISDV